MPFFHNYKIKLIVFIVAIFIWFFVITENEYENVIEIPVETVNLPEGKVILDDILEGVKVKVKGSGKDLIALGLSGGARVDLDLSDVEQNKTFFIEPRHIFLSRSAGAISFEEIILPDSIHVVVDDFHVKTVAIVPKVRIEVAPGFTPVGEIQLTPDSVVVSGPKSIVSQIDRIPTSEEEFSDLRFDLQQKVPLASPPSDKTEFSVSQTDIYLNIQELVEIKVTGVPVQVRHVPEHVTVYARPTTLSLVLEGGGDLLTQIDRDDIIAYIDYRRVRKSLGQEHPARIIPPPGVSYRDVQPRKFRLVFEKKSQ